MSSRTAPRRLVPIALLALFGSLAGLGGRNSPVPAGAQERPTATGPEASDRERHSQDERAIRAVDERFVRDYDKGDSKAVAGLFIEDADVVEADGTRYQGRELIERAFEHTFAANKGARIVLSIEAIRFLNHDAAKEDGRSVVTPIQGAPMHQLYTVLYVKRDGRWLVASVREEPDPTVSAHNRLKDLEWMVGDWVDEGSDSLVRLNCRWSEDGNFLIRSFTVKRQGKAVMTVTQRIGWDPQAKQVRSWEFDSEGGFGEGRWSRDGERWVVKHTGVRPDGAAASATNVLARERPDLVRWVSTDRALGSESVPDADGYVLVRVPPPPRLKSKGPATSVPSSSTERSPR